MNRGILLSMRQQVWPPHCSPKQRGTPNKEPGALNSCSGSVMVPSLMLAEKPQSQSMVIPDVFLGFIFLFLIVEKKGEGVGRELGGKRGTLSSHNTGLRSEIKMVSEL